MIEMKILLITPVFPPSIGGIEQHVFNLAKELNAKGVKADVLTAGIGAKKFSEKEKINGTTVFRVRTGLKDNTDLATKGSKMIFPLTKKIFALMKNERYDLMHAHCPFTLAACVPAKFYYNLPLIATIHGNWINCIRGRRYFEDRVCTKKDYFNVKRCARCLNQSNTKIKLKQFLLGSLAENCNELIAVSSDVKNSIKLNKKIPVRVIPNVSAKVKGLSRINARNSLNWAKKNKIILFLGSLIEEKGAMVLLEAARGILEKNKNAEFHLAYNFYDKAYLKKIKDCANKEKIEKKFFLHYKIPNPDIRRRFIPASDVIVLPSLWPEPCSTITTEAMSQGIPVISSRTGGFEDLIKNGADGILFKPGDSRDLSNKINSILMNEKKRKKIKENSLNKFNQSLNWGAVSNEVIKVYRGFLE